MSAALLAVRLPVAGYPAAGPTELAGTDELARRLDGHRRELVGHCHRILGSAADAEDAAQETLVRAWRHLDRFEQRSSLRTWLYRIATNVCVDATRARARRAVPVDLSPGAASGDGGPGHPGDDWAPPDRTRRRDPSPEDAAESAEAVERAFVAALAHLPRRQRVALVLYDVFRWPAQDVADLLGTTPASVTERGAAGPGDAGGPVGRGAARPGAGPARRPGRRLRRRLPPPRHRRPAGAGGRRPLSAVRRGR